MHLAARPDDATAAAALDRLDPRARLIAACVWAVAVVALSEPSALALAVAMAACMMPLARAPVRSTLRRMASMDGFILFMLATLPFTIPGEPLLTIWGYAASVDGLVRAVEIALTANAVALGALTLAGGLEPAVFGHALHRLGAPAALVHLFQFTLRYLDVLEGEYRRLRSAMSARGFQLRNDRHTYRSIGYLVGMMLVRALDRADRILEAMKCRGFEGRIPLLAQFRYGPLDAAFAAGLGSAILALVAVERLG